MRRLFPRGVEVPADVLARAGLGRSDKVLAGCCSDDGTWLLGTRDAFHIVASESPPVVEPVETRILWERVASADWSREDDRLRVAEVVDFGRPRLVHVFSLDEPGTLLPFLRERVSASVVLQRRVVVRGRQGLTVIARRPPSGAGQISWSCDLDPGLAADDPEVRAMADAGLRAAAEELGEA